MAAPDEEKAPLKAVVAESSRNADLEPVTSAPEGGYPSLGITDAHFSPDGKLVISVAGEVTLWEIRTGRKLRTFGWGAVAAAFSPDGKQLLAGGTAVPGKEDGQIALWDVASGKKVRAFGEHTGTVVALAFSPDGRYALSAGTHGCSMTLWEVASGKAIRTFVGHRWVVLAVAFSPEGKRLLSGGEDGTARLWDVNTGRELRRFPMGKGECVTAVQFLPTGRYALAAGSRMKMWETASGQEVASVAVSRWSVTSLCLLPGGKRALTTVDDGRSHVLVWDLRRGRFVPAGGWNSGAGRVCCRTSADGERALLYSQEVLMVWDLKRNQEICTLDYSANGCPPPVDRLAFSADGRRAIVVRRSEDPGLWDVATGKQAALLKGHERRVNAVAISADGKLALTGSHGSGPKLWDAVTGKYIGPLQAPEEFSGKPDAIEGLAFSRDGKLAVSWGSGNLDTGKGQLKVWAVDSRRMIRSLENGAGGVMYAAFLPDGKRVLSVDLLADNVTQEVRLWDVDRGSLLRSFRHTKGEREVALSPDGKHLIFYGDGGDRLRLWSVAEGRELRVLAQLEAGKMSAVYSPDGRYVLWSGSEERRLHVTEARTGKEVRAIPPRRVFQGVWALAVAPGGRLVWFEGEGEATRLKLYDPKQDAPLP